jgi:heptosyltransferase-1
LIVRMSAMGDILHTLPAAIALRQAYPRAILGWLIEERWADLLSGLETVNSQSGAKQPRLVDALHVVNTKKWRKRPLDGSVWKQIKGSLEGLRRMHYQVAVDFQGLLRSALLAKYSGAELRYGFGEPRERLARLLYNRPVAARGTHVIEQNMSLAEAAAHQSLAVPDFELAPDDEEQRACDAWLRQYRSDRFALLNPGAGWGAKQWPAERYGQVALRLAKMGLPSFVHAGPSEDGLARLVETASHRTAVPVTCSLPRLIALTRRAAVFIGGDTGPLHLAAALHVPVVAIFGPTNPARNGPFGTHSIVLRSPSSQTSHSRRPEPDRGLFNISTDEVVSAALKLVGSPG